jgi:hypothetical protein
VGRPREAIQIARSVLEGKLLAVPSAKALLLTRKARALSQGGDESAFALFSEVRVLFLDG